MDETPVLETNVKASEQPLGPIGEAVILEGLCNFALVVEAFQLLSFLVALEIVQEATSVFRKDGFGIVSSGDAGWVSIGECEVYRC